MDNPTIIFDVRITPVTLEALLSSLKASLETSERAIISHVHITGLNIAYNTPWFRDFLNRAAINYCDGMGVLLASRFLGCPLPARCTLVDWLADFASICERSQKSWYFLGNKPGSAEKVACEYRQKFPCLEIKGAHHGYFDFSYEHPETLELVREINRLKPDVLFVGLGMPIQEKWLSENWERLEVRMALTCGGTFDTLAGVNKRGPDWMTQNYLEWLSRLVFSPRKYSRRYLKDLPLFFYRILIQKFQG